MISTDQLRTPLSGSPCVYWHTVEVCPAERRHEHGGGEVMIADGTGAARVDLAGPVIFIRSDNYHEIAGPDWALHLETSLAEGDAVHVAGPVTLAPDRDAGGAHRGGVSPLFVGQADQPLIVRRETRWASTPSCALPPPSPGPRSAEGSWPWFFRSVRGSPPPRWTPRPPIAGP